MTTHVISEWLVGGGSPTQVDGALFRVPRLTQTKPAVLSGSSAYIRLVGPSLPRKMTPPLFCSPHAARSNARSGVRAGPTCCDRTPRSAPDLARSRLRDRAGAQRCRHVARVCGRGNSTRTPRGGEGVAGRTFRERVDRAVPARNLSGRSTSASSYRSVDRRRRGRRAPVLHDAVRRGESLRARLSHGELPIAEAISVLRDVARALAYAHEKGVAHRDIKPDNVLLAGGLAVITDFGVAKALSEAVAGGPLTSIGVALGTPAYMAPEQAAADPATDLRADIYAFGAMAYELLAGHVPFAGRSAQAMLAAHATEAPRSIALLRPATPELLADLVMRCLEKRPGDRPQSAGEIVQTLNAAVTTSGTRVSAGALPAGLSTAPRRTHSHCARRRRDRRSGGLRPTSGDVALRGHK